MDGSSPSAGSGTTVSPAIHRFQRALRSGELLARVRWGSVLLQPVGHDQAEVTEPPSIMAECCGMGAGSAAV